MPMVGERLLAGRSPRSAAAASTLCRRESALPGRYRAVRTQPLTLVARNRAVGSLSRLQSGLVSSGSVPRWVV